MGIKTLHTQHSISGAVWPEYDRSHETEEMLEQRYQVSVLVANFLSNRFCSDSNISKGTLQDIEHFLYPKLRNMPDPYIMMDMEKLVLLLSDSIKKNETIAIFGDYDVDGATSTTLMVQYLQSIGVKNVLWHIPERQDGYGPNIQAFKDLTTQGADLIICVDCGTSAFDVLQQAYDKNIRVCIIDHHIAQSKLPKSLAVVNPNRLDDDSDLGFLCAVGVCFCVLVALNRHLRTTGFFTTIAEPNLKQWLGLVAIGTVCDVVPLQGLNRVFVSQGLKQLNSDMEFIDSMIKNIEKKTDISDKNTDSENEIIYDYKPVDICLAQELWEKKSEKKPKFKILQKEYTFFHRSENENWKSVSYYFTCDGNSIRISDHWTHGVDEDSQVNYIGHSKRGFKEENKLYFKADTKFAKNKKIYAGEISRQVLKKTLKYTIKSYDKDSIMHAIDTIKNMLDVAKNALNIPGDIGGYALGWIIGPYLNACGRMGRAKLAVQFLLETDPTVQGAMALTIQGYNTERKEMVDKAVLEARQMVQKDCDYGGFICVFGDWSDGIIGIVAGRLKDYYNKPAIVFSSKTTPYKGSARSVQDIDVGSTFIQAVNRGILHGGGGHKMAAGCSVLPEKYDSFIAYLKTQWTATKYDKVYDTAHMRISPYELNTDMVDSLQQLEPYGMGNPEPLYIMENVIITSYNILKQSHIRFSVRTAIGAKTLSVIAFGVVGTDGVVRTDIGDCIVNSVNAVSVSLLGKVRINTWNGRKSVQFLLQDITLYRQKK